MQVLLRLYDMVNRASDGSRIDRSITQEYLQSADYKIMMDNKLALGGITHKDRKLNSSYSDLLPEDDQLLVSENITHYISKIYLEPDDNYAYAIITVLDPEEYSGKRAENIRNLIGDLKSNIQLPVSVVINCDWAPNGDALKINSIKGVDFTLGPAFEGAGIVKISEGKTFSRNTRSFSSDAIYSFNAKVVSSSIQDPEVVTRDSVKKLYGYKSKEYKIISDYGTLPLEEFNKLLDGGKSIESTKNYSVPTTSLRDRLEFLKQPKILSFKYTLKCYRIYISQNDLTEEQSMDLQELLVKDIQLLIKCSASSILEGKSLSTLFGLDQLSSQIKETGDALSIKYRSILLSQTHLDYIPRARYIDWIDSYREFLSAIINYVFQDVKIKIIPTDIFISHN